MIVSHRQNKIKEIVRKQWYPFTAFFLIKIWTIGECDDMIMWWCDDMMIWWYDDMMIWWYDDMIMKKLED